MSRRVRLYLARRGIIIDPGRFRAPRIIKVTPEQAMMTVDTATAHSMINRWSLRASPKR